MRTTAIIVAAGRGHRAGGPMPKQFQMLQGRPVLAWTVDAFARHPGIDDVVLVLHPDDESFFADIVGGAVAPYLIAQGGVDRAASVLSGLMAAPEGTTQVLIQDGARPLVSSGIIDRVLAALTTHSGAAPALQATDALWTGQDGLVTGMQDRTGLWRAQTPQGFHYDAICAAHAQHPGGAADDVAVAMAAGLDVAIVQGEERNLKITRREDFARAAKMMETHLDIRTGNGFDVHRFCDGDHVVICGVKIPFHKALQGHSDADVGMHAVTDAIYGALAEGDIGQHFPPSDPQWKAAASEIFLAHAVALAAERGYAISNADCTLICEQPKIGPLAPAMRAEMARIMGLEVTRVSVKATTSETLGFTGRGEGIAALASVTLVAQ